MKPSRSRLGGVMILYILLLFIYWMSNKGYIGPRSWVKWTAHYNYFVTEPFGMSWGIWNNIVVRYFTKDIKMFILAMNRNKLSDRNIKGAYWGNNMRPPITLFSSIHIFPSQWRRIAYFSTNLSQYVYSGCITAIFNISNKSPYDYVIFRINKFCYFYIFHRHKSALGRNGYFGAFLGGIGSFCGLFEGPKYNETLDSTNNYKTTSKYRKPELEAVHRIFWWRRILCGFVFLVTGIYCACNGINHLLRGNKLFGWLFLVSGLLLGQLFAFALGYGLFLSWLGSGFTINQQRNYT